MQKSSVQSKWQSNQTNSSSAQGQNKAAPRAHSHYGYRDLRIWCKAMEIARMIYDLTDTFPREEKFGLGGQLRRTAVSIPSVIAEGYSRGDQKVFRRSLEIVKGSLAELETQLELARCLNFTQDLKDFRDKIQHERSMIQKILKKDADTGSSVSVKGNDDE